MSDKIYRFLPFRFTYIRDKVLLVNEVGEFYFMDKEKFKRLVKWELDINSDEFFDLKSKCIVTNSNLENFIEILATKYRTKKAFLYNFTSLHMIALTQRCNHNCSYCHASSIDENSDKDKYDMNAKTAFRCVDTIFSSPSDNIKIEFQGGEPLLNFEVLKKIVEYAIELNKRYKKNLEFVICTNLVNLTPNILDFIKKYGIYISTSLDGPSYLHDLCRKLRNGRGSYDLVIDKITWLMQEYDKEKISALMTTTNESLCSLEKVVDEYIHRGFKSIFIRDLNMFGRAKYQKMFYMLEDFIYAYKKVFEYILKINKSGFFFSESYATLLLTRILTPFSTGFVDLQSPAGTGIGGVIYNYNGDVFISDEARMLAAEGDKEFKLGNVNENSYSEIFFNEKLIKIITKSCIEALPGCSWCAFLPYCGSDPVKNYVLKKSKVNFIPSNYFCKKHKYLFNFLFDLLQKNDSEILNIFWSWITGRSLNQISLEYNNR